MSRGVEISYISGMQRGFQPQLKQPGIFGPEEAEAQTLLDGIIIQDQSSFYLLNTAKSQLLDLINQYTAGTLTSWTITDYNEANARINEINQQLNAIKFRQSDIAANNDIEVQETGLNPQFSDFIAGIRGPIYQSATICYRCNGDSVGQYRRRGAKIGAIDWTLITLAIINPPLAITIYFWDDIIDWLNTIGVESDVTAERTAILEKAAMSLTPEEQQAYWADINRQIKSAYNEGHADAQGFFGNLVDLMPYAAGGVVLYLLWPAISNVRKKYSK